jgi:hypothetical protein
MNMRKLAAAKAKVNEPAKRLKLKPYVRLPRDLLAQPPIRHRHTPASLNYLWPFDFGVMAAVIAVASTRWHGKLSSQAFADSGERQRQLHAEMERKRNLRLIGIKTRPAFDGRRMAFDGRRMTSKEMFEQFGSRAFQQSRSRRMRQGAPATITVTSTATALLTCVGLASNGDNRHRLERTLDRLLEPVAQRPPLLLGWERLADNRVRLEVDGLWLYADEVFKYLPRRLPLHAPTVLALFLFLSSLRWTKGNNRYDITFFALFERLGLRYSRQGHRRLSATLGAALDYINRYLTRLHDRDLKGLRVEASYEIRPIGINKLRFVSRSRHLAERLEAEEYAEERRQLTVAAADDDDDDEWSNWDEDIKQRDANKKKRRAQQAAEDDDGEDFEPVNKRFGWKAQTT